MVSAERCQRCGHALELLRQPVRRLRWTRYWWKGLASLLTGQLRVCSNCGAIYTGEGELLAAGAVETEAEHRLNVYRKDMAYIRDSFAAVVVAAELVVIWMTASVGSLELAKVILAGSVGGAALVPFAYFGRKAGLASRDLKRLREARRKGHIPRESGQ